MQPSHLNKTVGGFVQGEHPCCQLLIVKAQSLSLKNIYFIHAEKLRQLKKFIKIILSLLICEMV